MKRIINYILFIILGVMILIPNTVHAAGVTLDIYSSNNNPTVGSTITVTVYAKSSGGIGSCDFVLTYDTSKLKLTSGRERNSIYSQTGKEKTLSETFKFKVIGTGTSKISAKGVAAWDWNEKALSTTVDPATVTGKSASSSSSTSKPVSYSTNNYLSSLKVDNYSISPKFNKNTLDYKLTIPNNVEEINISASKEDNKATISGTGKKKVSEGDNKFSIVVTSEKGTKRTYNLVVSLKDDNPINVTIDNNNYTVIKRASSLKSFKNYKAKEVTINNIKVPALYNDITKYTLVGLKDKDGNSNMYVYNENDGSFTLYKEYTFNNINVALVETKDIINNLKEAIIKINDEDVKVYKSNDKDTYSYIYAMNVETGEINWYSIEETENTIQKYNSNQVENKDLTKKLKDTTNIMYLASGISILFGILLILVASSKNKKRKRKNKKEKKEDITKEIEQDLNNDIEKEEKKPKKKRKEKTILDE